MKTYIKNKANKSKVILTIIIFAIISMFSIGCTPTSVTPTCSTTNTNFQQLYNSVAAISGNVDDTIYDSEVHEYSFTVSNNETVCQIGYGGQSAMPNGPLIYNIQLRDSTTNTALYLINTTLDTLQSTYLSVPNVILIPGHIYTVKRTLTSHYMNYPYTIGRMVYTPPVFTPLSFPITLGNMTVIGSKFFDYSTSAYAQNIGIPYIDIVFQQ